LAAFTYRYVLERAPKEMEKEIIAGAAKA